MAKAPPEAPATYFRLGYRFRLHRRDLPGTLDLVFPGRRKVIFVHGCFWHRHPDPGCRLARICGAWRVRRSHLDDEATYTYFPANPAFGLGEVMRQTGSVWRVTE